MSERQKVLLVGLGLTAAVVAAVSFFVFINREPAVTGPETGSGEEVSFTEDGPMVRSGTVSSISVSGTDVTVSSAEGNFSFSISSADIIGLGGVSASPDDIVIGMELEATVLRGEASVVTVISAPPIAVISPRAGDVTGLLFDVEGIAYGREGDICLSLMNRRTGTVYGKDLSSSIDNEGKFSVTVDMSTALDGMAGDMLDAEISVCGESDITRISWGYYSGLTSKIKVYFLKNSCNSSFYVERVISASRSAVRASIEEMLEGPNATESADGIFSSASPTEKIRSIDVQPGIVYLDFYPTITSLKSCNLSTLRSQIIRTLDQFPMDTVVITIEGEKNNPLNQ
jgi:hypothetical protein